jgi:hypothetical protein
MKSNSGAACTCVVTEYHYHDSVLYAVEVDLFTMEEIESQLRDMIRSYRAFHQRDDELESEEYEVLESQADLARDTFKAMFRDRLDGDRFLTDEAEDTAVQTLVSWARQLYPSTLGGRQTKNTLAECSSSLMQLTSEHVSNQTPSVWPYIRKIRYVPGMDYQAYKQY